MRGQTTHKLVQNYFNELQKKGIKISLILTQPISSCFFCGATAQLGSRLPHSQDHTQLHTHPV